MGLEIVFNKDHTLNPTCCVLFICKLNLKITNIRVIFSAGRAVLDKDDNSEKLYGVKSVPTNWKHLTISCF